MSVESMEDGSLFIDERSAKRFWLNGVLQGQAKHFAPHRQLRTH